MRAMNINFVIVVYWAEKCYDMHRGTKTLKWLEGLGMQRRLSWDYKTKKERNKANLTLFFINKKGVLVLKLFAIYSLN